MSNFIELAYLLQRNYDLIKKNKKVLKDGSHIYFLKKLKKEFDDKKQNYSEKKKKLEDIKNKYGIMAKKLNNQKKEIEDNEYKLYNKAGSNLNVISKLEKSIDSGKQKLKKFEDEAVELLENEEKVSIELENLRLELINIRNNFYDYKQKSSEKIDNAEEHIKVLEKKVEEIKKDMPSELLYEINKLLENSDSAVVKLNGSVCDGCRMKVSAVTMDNIYKGAPIVHCDNCGRILYYDSKKQFEKKAKTS